MIAVRTGPSAPGSSAMPTSFSGGNGGGSGGASTSAGAAGALGAGTARTGAERNEKEIASG